MKNKVLSITMIFLIGLLSSCNNQNRSTEWLVGESVPNENIGNLNDFYFNTKTNDIYQKTEDGWIIITNLKGDKGENGSSPKIEISDDGYWIINGEKTDVFAGERKKQNWNVDHKLKILTIGNSFSDDTMEYVYQIATSAGVENVELGNLYIPGCSLETHYNNAKSNDTKYEYRTNSNGSWSTTKSYRMLDAVKGNDWDFISFQQASGQSGIESSYTYLNGLMEIVKNNCISKDTRFVWNMTWAYQQNSSHGDFAKYDKSQAKMYSMICSTVQDQIQTNEEIEIISPTGTAIQNARESYLGDKLTRDGYHLTYTYGRFIAGCTFFSSLTGIGVDKITYYPTNKDAQLGLVMNSLDFSLIKESIKNALKTPFKTTESEFQMQVINDKKYVCMPESLMDFKDFAFYNSTANDDYYNPKFNDSISKNYITTKRFNKKDLPIGSLITILDGWQYRPEGWINGAKNDSSSRPNNVSTSQIEVDAYWWGRYTERAFNISKVGGESISNSELKNAHEALKIYVFYA